MDRAFNVYKAAGISADKMMNKKRQTEVSFCLPFFI